VPTLSLVRLRPPAILLVLLGLLLASFPPAAGAEGNAALVPQVVPASSADWTPRGFRVSAGEAVRIASQVDEVRRERTGGRSLRARPGVPLYESPRVRWEVGFERPGGDRVVEVHVDGRSGEVLEIWTGAQVDTLLARGYEPSVGGELLNAPYVWLPLCLLFLLPFVDPRRPLRLLHLDLLVLLGFGLSQLFLNRGEIDLSVPLAYPFLAYLLVRLLVAGFRPREGRGPLVPVVPISLLAVALVLLLGFRVALNVTDSSVIDVGYASVVGADRILHGEELYIDNEIHGDAYGPLNYVAYIPFELVFPTKGAWDDVPAAHAAALTFDLLTVAGLFLLGLRLRRGREGRLLGIALAFAWTAYPYSTYVLQSNTNDGLVAMILVYALLALSSPPARGALLAVGTAVKFIPMALAPLFAAGTGDRRATTLARFAIPLVFLLVAAAGAYLPDGGFRELWDTTLGFQLGRESAFSLWGLHPSLEPLQTLVKVAAAGLAVAVFALPRRRDALQVAALGAAVLIAFQLAAEHWFYFYLVWFAPLALVAMLSPQVPSGPGAESPPARDRAAQTA
jgi:hypothetical protein